MLCLFLCAAAAVASWAALASGSAELGAVGSGLTRDQPRHRRRHLNHLPDSCQHHDITYAQVHRDLSPWNATGLAAGTAPDYDKLCGDRLCESWVCKWTAE